MSAVPAFFSDLARLLNSGQTRAVVLSGNVHDLFPAARPARQIGGQGDTVFVPLVPFLLERTETAGLIRVVYELNGPVRVGEADRAALKDAWVRWKTGADADTLLLRGLGQRGETEGTKLGREFDQLMHEAIGRPTQALEFLRQLTICSREALNGSLLILIEAADVLLPAGQGGVSGLPADQLRRVTIVEDWFCDPDFIEGGDSVVLIADSRSAVHPRVGRLPQVLGVEVPAPDVRLRLDYIEDFLKDANRPVRLWAGEEAGPESLAQFAAGLNLHALRQLLAGAAHSGEPLTPAGVIGKVEEFIRAQLGEDVIEFKKPEHSLEDVVGFEDLKAFLREELIPRFQASGEAALPGAAVAGAIGSGKTFLMEAVAAELDLPVLVLKNIRSQWFGQTDVVFEKLRRVLEALQKAVIFVDEADTQFGGVGSGTHETERRLTGKVQAMMSDPKLRGRILWLLMTARIHLLSPDVRRPGRVGDLIIPVLDPTGEDRRAFIRWVVNPAVGNEPSAELITRLDAELSPTTSAAAYASLRSDLKARRALSSEGRAAGETLSEEDVFAAVRDRLPPAIQQTRRYQELQALVNCTRRSLLPDPDVTAEQRAEWETELRALERLGIH
ncbi:AAA family ATPase [Alienimonas sp. DA493]|uniref:AAA family ATPase n=1 Tax=Alienimonas sp. DA493 TaxID=3373605 RepID=UPI0037549D8E